MFKGRPPDRHQEHICLSDPGVEIARKFVNILVLCSLNISLHVSQIVGHRTLLLVPEYAGTRFQFPEIITTYGLRDRVVVRGPYASIQRHFRPTGTTKGQIQRIPS